MGGTEGKGGEMEILAGLNPPAEDSGTSTETNQGTSQGETKTYTEEEYQASIKEAQKKAFSDFMAESGRKYKSVEDDNKNLKAQLASKTAELESLADERRDLTQQIDDLAKGDPDRKILNQRLREVRDREIKLKSEKAVFDNERSEFQKSQTERWADTIAAEYKVDKTLLLSITDGSRERMEALAKVLPKAEGSTSPPTKAKAKPPVFDSGVTKGTSGKLQAGFGEHMTMEQYAEHPEVKKRYGIK
jgi:hypothetical protein